MAKNKVTNFKSKKDRKAARKGVIRGTVSNAIADAKVDSQERIAFYRRLREMKLRRREIARQMQNLSELVTELQMVVRTEVSRKPHDPIQAEDFASLANTARAKSQGVADDYHRLSRQKIYYGERMAA
ncbi:hypothetical protein ABZ805_29020 [Saccharopolyspora sp. NPDC047091]|uniref:hypothetical protein n=1 Tax=Saccharopolyspora sp. NPDC047091 TaxID=3155924 RepID=UPI0033FFCD29